MTNLSDEMAKRPCAFVMKLKQPLPKSSEILVILSDRDIKVSTMHLHNHSDNDGILILHCLIEKDRSRYILHLLQKLKGVSELELLERKITNQINI
jgi:hypothetical protein